jgi:enoyl-CoA hydratase
MPASGQILIEAQGGIATIRLANPRRRNAISTPMWQALGAFAAGVGARTDIRVVIVRAEGESAFSAGADISDFAEGRSQIAQAASDDDMVEDACRAFEAMGRGIPRHELRSGGGGRRCFLRRSCCKTRFGL